MKIDGNELAILQNDLDRRGQKQEAWKIKQEFLKQVRESGDHCPCQEKCPHHGNCFECVTLHRGHRDHLPMCMWDMLNERIAALSHMTEGTLYEYEAQESIEILSYYYRTGHGEAIQVLFVSCLFIMATRKNAI